MSESPVIEVPVTSRIQSLYPSLPSIVPLTLKENVRYRRMLNQLAMHDASWRDDLWIQCKRDIIFWLGSFGWLNEPRDDLSSISVIPWVPWPYQCQAIRQLEDALGKRDVEIYKARDMGATWMVLAVFMHRWLFYERKTFLLVSRKEELVDAKGNMKALLPKCEFIIDHLPRWMRPQFDRRDMHLGNCENHSVIAGESTNKDVGRADRLTAMLLDEFAAVENSHEVYIASRASTNCRIFNSTPQGAGNAYYDLHMKREAGELACDLIDLPWHVHPVKQRGLYRGAKGQLEIYDKTFPFPKDYPFILDGDLRSPDFDYEESRCITRQDADQELRRSFNAFGSQFFEEGKLQDIRLRTILPHTAQGELQFDPQTGVPRGFSAMDNSGALRLWLPVDANGKVVAPSRYVVAADISMGTGASNSAIVVVDRETGWKVAEWADPFVQPAECGEYAVALCNWFAERVGRDEKIGAFLIWEANLGGKQFGKRVMEMGYTNFYWRPQSADAHNSTRSDVPGFWSSGYKSGSKQRLLLAYKDDLHRGKFVERSILALQEHREYKFIQPGGTIEHIKARNKLDPSGARENHGDRVMANAMASMFIDKEAAEPTESNVKKVLAGLDRREAPRGSMAWLIAEDRKRQRELEAADW